MLSKRTPIALADGIQSLLDLQISKELGVYLVVPLTSGVPRLKHFASLKAKVSQESGMDGELSHSLLQAGSA